MTKRKDPKDKLKVGRPTVFTPEITDALKACFLNGYTDEQAYNSVGISKNAFYSYCELHPEFKYQKEVWKKDVDAVAKANLVTAIREGDKVTSQWWLERKCKQEFSKSPEVINNNNNQQTVYVTKKDEDDANEYIDSIIQG